MMMMTITMMIRMMIMMRMMKFTTPPEKGNLTSFVCIQFNFLLPFDQNHPE